MVLRGESNLNNQEQGEKLLWKKVHSAIIVQADDYVHIDVLYFVYLFRCSWLGLDFS